MTERWICTSSGAADLLVAGARVEEVGFAIAWYESETGQRGQGWIEAGRETIAEALRALVAIRLHSGDVAITIGAVEPSDVHKRRVNCERRHIRTGPPPKGQLDNIIVALED